MQRGYQVDFVPYTETQYLSLDEKVNYILSKVTQRRILVLEKGELKGIGTYKELLENNSLYADIVESQFSGIKTKRVKR